MQSRLAILVLALAILPSRSFGEMVMQPPISGACISSGFGPRFLPEHPQAGTYHYGLDLPAAVGSPVRAVAPGTVVRVQRKGPGGLEMLVQHPGFIGVYSHLGMVAPAIADGKRTVAEGEKLGVVGRTGVSSGPHLYFEMILNGKPVDPTSYLRLARCGGAAPPPTVKATAKRDDTGVVIDGHRYYQVLLPARH
jgi:murein DD-endopeptidase MepM/ murein hydrolase activator NlpD